MLLESLAHNIIHEGVNRCARGKVIRTPVEITICCPHPGHRERTPSCHINLTSKRVPIGYVRCFGCREKGHWNDWAKWTGWQKMPKDAADSKQAIRSDLNQYTATVGKSLLADTSASGKNRSARWRELATQLEDVYLMPVEGPWRGLETKFMKRLGMEQYIDNETGFIWRIIPVKVDGGDVGLVYARSKPEPKKPSYINSRNQDDRWVVARGLLGYDLIKKLPLWKKHKIVFLVEGPRDALVLIAMGIPAISMLGANSWPKDDKFSPPYPEKIQLLDQLGARRIILLMDNDQPGRKAAKHIQKDWYKRRRTKTHLARWRFPAEKDTGQKMDPAMLKSKQAHRLFEAAVAEMKTSRGRPALVKDLRPSKS